MIITVLIEQDKIMKENKCENLENKIDSSNAIGLKNIHASNLILQFGFIFLSSYYINKYWNYSQNSSPSKY